MQIYDAERQMSRGKYIIIFNIKSQQDYETKRQKDKKLIEN